MRKFKVISLDNTEANHGYNSSMAKVGEVILVDYPLVGYMESVRGKQELGLINQVAYTYSMVDLIPLDGILKELYD